MKRLNSAYVGFTHSNGHGWRALRAAWVVSSGTPAGGRLSEKVPNCSVPGFITQISSEEAPGDQMEPVNHVPLELPRKLFFYWFATSTSVE